MLSIQYISRLACEPLTLEQTKKDLKISASNTDDDDFITQLIAAARSYSESYTGQTWIATTYRMYLDGFQRYIYLPKGKVASITAITYTNTDGATATLSTEDYSADLHAIPARIFIPEAPGTKANILGAVAVEYVAGYTDADEEDADIIRAAVPERARQAMSLLVANWYQNREDFYTERDQAPRAARLLLRTLKTDHFYTHTNG